MDGVESKKIGRFRSTNQSRDPFFSIALPFPLLHILSVTFPRKFHKHESDPRGKNKIKYQKASSYLQFANSRALQPPLDVIDHTNLRRNRNNHGKNSIQIGTPPLPNRFPNSPIDRSRSFS